MPKHLVTITNEDGEVYVEFVITNPDYLIELIGLPDVGVIPGGEWNA
jgi:hypothetical protein